MSIYFYNYLKIMYITLFFFVEFDIYLKIFRVYPALETVTEPHRLTQSLHILACICIPLVRDDPSKSNGERHPLAFGDRDSNAYLKSYRGQALSILINILPGIDVNDIAKSILTFQVNNILIQ